MMMEALARGPFIRNCYFERPNFANRIRSTRWRRRDLRAAAQQRRGAVEPRLGTRFTADFCFDLVHPRPLIASQSLFSNPATPLTAEGNMAARTPMTAAGYERLSHGCVLLMRCIRVLIPSSHRDVTVRSSEPKQVPKRRGLWLVPRGNRSKSKSASPGGLRPVMQGGEPGALPEVRCRACQ